MLVERETSSTTEKALRTAAEAEVQEATGRRSVYLIQHASTGQPLPEQGYRDQVPPHLLPSQNSMRVPEFDGHGQLHLWSSRIQTFMKARRLMGVLEPTSNPIRIVGGVRGMEERNRSVNHHGQKRV